MKIQNLKKEELLKMRDEINLQLKHIDELKKEVVKSKEKTKLSDLNNGDKIFCIRFYGSEIYGMDYVPIEFWKKDEDDYYGWTNFSTLGVENSIGGMSSCIKDECMNNHFFLSDGCSSYEFFTLKPQSWREDLLLELDRFIKFKKDRFNQEILKFKSLIFKLIDSDGVDSVLDNFLK
jgi:hypothetical protein